MLLPLPAAAAQEGYAALDIQDLSSLSIEELAQIPVRSASKREEPLAAAPTALYVITDDEIEASAAMSLPEAVRLAPNLQVQQVNAGEYAITARGFNSVETSNKLLVLIDGRTVYTPLHSGVFWQLHNPIVEDIAQIEVISGPGGTLYGPNAVNGVVNVITQDARDTLGTMARGTVGANERTAALRHGLSFSPSSALRIYGTWFDREDLPAAFGSDHADRFRGWQAGFRADFAGERDHLTVQGDAFDTDSFALPGDGDDGHNLLARWTRTLGATSSLQIQAYYDYFERDFIRVHDSLQTFDLETQLAGTHGIHEFVIGGSIRTTRDEFINNLNPFVLDPESRRLWVFSAFAQDRIRLAPDLSLILGLKAEESTFSGLELLPNARVAWQPGEKSLLWAAVSRAVRTPSRIDRQLVNLPVLAQATGFQSEKLIAFEAGYRSQPADWTTLSVSGFFNLYDDIRTTELSPGGTLPIRLSNGLQGHTYGIEAWSSSRLAPWWRVDLGLATLWKDFRLKEGRVDLANRDALGHDPNFQLLARTTIEPMDRLRINAGLRYVGEIDTAPRISGYVEADARIGYHLTDAAELFVAGRNLLHGSHLESNDPQRAQRPERSLYAGARFRF